jgi:hypothetical protein
VVLLEANQRIPGLSTSTRPSASSKPSRRAPSSTTTRRGSSAPCRPRQRPLIGAVVGGSERSAAGTTCLRHDGRDRGHGLAAPIFFTLSRSRLPTYGLQALPFIAILVAAGSPRSDASGGDPAGRLWRRQCALSALGLGIATIAGAVAFVVSRRGAPPAALAALATGVALACLALARPRTGLLAVPGRRAPLLTLAACLVAGAAASADPFEAGAQRSLVEAMNAARAPGEQIGVALHKNGDWGVTPFYTQQTARFFGYEARLAVKDPAELAPDRFRPLDDLTAWLAAPERRFLFVRTKEVDDLARSREISRRFGSATLHVVARGPLYSVVTNHPLGTR